MTSQASPTRSCLRHRRAERRVREAARHAVGDVEAREQKARAEGGGIQQVDRHADGRTHHHQHDARGDQDPERAACGDRACRQPGIIAGLDHNRSGHDAEHRDGRADDAGRHGEDGRRQDHRQVERAAHGREQVAQRQEQPLHQARLLRHVAHEDEERHGGQDVVLHRAPDLQVGEVEGLVRADADRAEDEGEEQQREGDREADEDDADHADQHDEAEDFIEAHRRLTLRSSRGEPAPRRCGRPTCSSSTRRCLAGTAARRLTGSRARSGQITGCQIPEVDFSLIDSE